MRMRMGPIRSASRTATTACRGRLSVLAELWLHLQSAALSLLLPRHPLRRRLLCHRPRLCRFLPLHHHHYLHHHRHHHHHHHHHRHHHHHHHHRRPRPRPHEGPVQWGCL